jgi:hypothetical protein
MLIDDYLPRYHVSEHHELLVPVPAPETYAAIWQADLAASIVVKTLLALRSLPARLFDAAPARPAATRLTLHDIVRHGFCLLAEEKEREVVLGASGCFWRPTGNLSATDPARFREPPPAGTARAAWNFTVSQPSDGVTLLSTETRVLCADDGALRSFRRYWMVVGPFSGLIRRHMLRTIGHAAEARRGHPDVTYGNRPEMMRE